MRSQGYIRLSRYISEGHGRAVIGFGQIEVRRSRRKHTIEQPSGVKAVAEAFGYSAEELTSIPAEANMGLSCGNPTATAHLRPGEVVVDLGSGGGLDVFLASKMVGPEGRAIGIDMTPAMIERARANAQSGGYTNVEFHQSTIDKIPLAGCFCRLRHLELRAQSRARQARRLPRNRPRAQARWPRRRQRHSTQALNCRKPSLKSMAAYVGCIAGAIHIEDYRAGLLTAGFEHVEIVDSGADLNAYTKVENQAGCCSPAGCRQFLDGTRRRLLHPAAANLPACTRSCAICFPNMTSTQPQPA